MPPATLFGEGEEPRQGGLRDDREVKPLAGVLGGAVELIEERYTGRARALLEGQEGSFAGRGSRSRPAVAAREHEVVDDQRILSGCEELREAHVGGGAVCPGALEDVVLGDLAPRWKPASSDSHCLHRAPKF